MYSFKQTSKEPLLPWSGRGKFEVEVKVEHTDIPDICQAFEDFLKGCGFTFSGHVTIVDELQEEILRAQVRELEARIQQFDQDADESLKEY